MVRKNRNNDSILLRRILFSLLCVAIMLSACSGNTVTQQTSSAPAVQNTSEVKKAEQPTATITATPTSTEIPYPFHRQTAIPTPESSLNTLKGNNLIELARWGKGTINDVVVSPDKSLLAVASSTGIYLYDMANLQEKDYLDFEGLPAHRLRFSADGQKLAVKFALQAISIYNLSAQKWVSLSPPDETQSFTNDVKENFAFSPDGESLLVVRNGSVAVMDCESGETIKRTSLPEGEAFHPILVTPDGQKLFLIVWNAIHLVNLTDNSDPVTIPVDNAGDFLLSDDGQYLVGENNTYSSGSDAQLLVIKTDDGKVLRKIRKSDFGTSAGDIYFNTRFLFSPDSKTLAVSYSPGPVCLWNLEKNLSFGCIDEANTASHTDIAFSSDGKTIFSARNSGLVSQWNIADKTLVREFGQKDGETAQFILPASDKSLIVVKQADNANKNAQTITRYIDQPQKEVTVQTEEKIRDLRFSPKDDLIITAGEKAVSLWNVHDGQKKASIPADALLIKPSLDGVLLAVANQDNSVQLYSLPDAVKKFTLSGHKNPVTGMFFLPGKSNLVTTSKDETIVWDTTNGSRLFTLPESATVLQILPTSSGFATIDQELTLKSWDLETQTVVNAFESLKGKVTETNASDYAGITMAVLGDGGLNLADMQSGVFINAIPVEGLKPERVVLTGNGEHAIVAAENGMQVFDTATGTQINSLPGAFEQFDVSSRDGRLATVNGSSFQIWSPIGNLPVNTQMDFSGKDRGLYLTYISNTKDAYLNPVIIQAASSVLVTGSTGYQEVIDSKSGKLLAHTQTQQDISIFAFSPDASTRGFGGNDKDYKPVITIKPMNAQSENTRTLYPPHQSKDNMMAAVTSISISNTGMIVTAIDDTKESFIDIWGDQDQEPIASLPGHLAAISADGKWLTVVTKGEKVDKPVIYDMADPANPKLAAKINISAQEGFSTINAVVFSPDGSQIALGYENGIISIVDSKSGQVISRIVSKTGDLTGLVYSADGRQLFSQTADTVIRAWGIKPGAAVQPTSTPTNGPAESESTGVPESQPQASELVNPNAELPVLSSQNIKQLKLSGEWWLGENKEGYCNSCPQSISPVVEGSALFPGQEPDTLLLFGMDSLSLFNPYTDNEPKIQERWNFKLNYGILSPDGSKIIANDYKKPKIRVMTDFDSELPSKMIHSIEPRSSMYVYTPDGRFMVSLAMNYEQKKSELTVWNAQQDYEQVSRIIFDKEILNHLATKSLPDGSYRVFLGWKVFNLTADGKLQELIENADSPMRSFAPFALAISPDGNFLAAMNYENELKVFDTNTETEMTSLKMEFDRTVDENDWPQCTAMVFLPGSKGILTVHTDGIMRVWGAGNEMLAKVVVTPALVPTAYPMQSEEEMTAIENLARITPDNAEKLAEIKVWEADVCKPEENKNCTSYLTQVAGQSQILPEIVNGDLYILSSNHKKLLVNPFSNPPVQLYKPKNDFFYSSIAVSPDGKMVVDLSVVSKTVLLYDDTGVVLFELKGHELEYISDAAFTPDGRFLVTGFGDVDKPAEIFVWDTKTGELVGKQKDKGYLSKLRFIPTMKNDTYTLLGGYLFDISLPDSFRTYTISKEGKIELRNKGHIVDWGIDSLIVSPDGNLIGVGEGKGFIKILSADGKKEFAQIDTKAENRTTGAIFLASGKGILVARGDGTIALFGVKE